MFPLDVQKAVERLNEPKFAIHSIARRDEGERVDTSSVEFWGIGWNNQRLPEEKLRMYCKSAPAKLKRWGYETAGGPILFSGLKGGNEAQVDVEIRMRLEFEWVKKPPSRKSKNARVALKSARSSILVFTRDEHLIFRTGRDSEDLKSTLNARVPRRRPWFRIHFDCDDVSVSRTKNLAVPPVHFQIGGRDPSYSGDEWISDEVKEPRFACWPMCGFGAIDSVLGSYCPMTAKDVRRDFVWQKSAIRCEKALLVAMAGSFQRYKDGKISWHDFWERHEEPLEIWLKDL